MRVLLLCYLTLLSLCAGYVDALNTQEQAATDSIQSSAASASASLLIPVPSPSDSSPSPSLDDDQLNQQLYHVLLMIQQTSERNNNHTAANNNKSKSPSSAAPGVPPPSPSVLLSQVNSRLSAEENELKFARFLKLHPEKAATVAQKHDAPSTFAANRRFIVHHNVARNTSSLFSSRGPFAATAPSRFKASLLNAKSPVQHIHKVKQPTHYNLDLTYNPAFDITKLRVKSRGNKKNSPAASSAKSGSPAPSNTATAAKPKSKKRGSNQASNVLQPASAPAATPSLLESSADVEWLPDNYAYGVNPTPVQIPVPTPTAPTTTTDNTAATQAGGKAGIAGSKGGDAGGSAGIAGSKGGEGGGSAAIAGSKGGDSGGSAAIAGSKGGEGGSTSGISGSKGGDGGSSSLLTATGYGSFQCIQAQTFKFKIVPTQSMRDAQSAVGEWCRNLVGYCGGKDPSGAQPCGSSAQLPDATTIAQGVARLCRDTQMQAIAAEYIQTLVRSCGVGYLLTSLAGQSVADGGVLTPATITRYLLELGVPSNSIAQLFEIALTPRQIIGNENLPQVDEVCGSCWAHVTMYTLTLFRLGVDPSNAACAPWQTDCRAQALRNAGWSASPFSPQQILNCVHSATSSGCSGGSPMDALDFLAKNPIALLSEMPLTPTVSPCRPVRNTQPPSNQIWSDGWKMTAPACQGTLGICPKQALAEFAMARQMMSNGIAMIAYVDASNWQHYSEGIFPVNLCDRSMKAGNHVVTIVALKSYYGIPVWEVLNTWGNKWGSNGRIMLPAMINACGIANFVIQSVPPAHLLAQAGGDSSNQFGSYTQAIKAFNGRNDFDPPPR